VLVVASAGASAQYQPDWTHRNFYEQINFCRAALMFPAARDFERRTQASGRSAEESRNAAISFLPVPENFATVSCYCALNEAAKSVSHASLVSDRVKLMGYLQGGKCKEASDQALRALQTLPRERASELLLK